MTLSRTTLHLTAGAVGLVALVGVWFRQFGMIDGPLAIANTLVFILAAFILFTTRKADEYVAALWRAGTSAAFVGLLACYLFGPFIEGLIDGLMGGERSMQFRADLAPEITFTFFYLAHLWARVRGTY